MNDLPRRIEELLHGEPPATAEPARFFGRQFDLGLAWVHFPEGFGGLGLPAELQIEVDQAIAAAGGPPARVGHDAIGMGMVAPTIARHGTDAQRGYLRDIFTMETIWCQLFSEPGAGSDLAGLATRAEKTPGGWLVNGQKVWTSVAHLSRRGLLLARTDPDAVKHRGLSCFLLDMKAPGVEVRPLYQITGEAEFNEVYLTDVFIPDDHLLGDPGSGWRVALTTLMNERSSIGGMMPPRGVDMLSTVLHTWHDRGWQDPIVADELVKLWIRADLACLTARRAAQEGARGVPGPEGSIGKLQWAELGKEAAEFRLRLLAEDGLVYPTGYERRRSGEQQADPDNAHYMYLRSRAHSIEGGTSDIMRNILGERVLGLPEEPRVDKDRPWREVPRG